MTRYRTGIRCATIFGIVATVSAGIWFWQATHQWRTALSVLCPGVALTSMLLLGSDNVLERLNLWVKANPARIALAPAGLWLLYLIYAIGMGIADAGSALLMAAYLGIPFLAFYFSRKLEPFVILWLWLPLEFGLVRRLLETHGPGIDAHYVFGQLLAVNAGIIAWAVWNQTPGIGYRFELDRKILKSGLINFAVFAAIAIPLGLSIHFIRYSFTLQKLYPAPLAFIGIFLFVAFPEEFLFRGLIQNWIERRTGSRAASLVIASIIFGASHLNNGPPVPNYKYFLMASIAGVFYGRAWRSTGSLIASSMTHALVDTLWSVIFR
jgi:membrane protease YdiL (CAAX protease family)